MAFLQVRIDSQTLDMRSMMNVILPERPSPRPDGKWPALYLLHGLSGDHMSWQSGTSIERYAEGYGLAIVMPEVQRSFYTDMKHGLPYWTYVSEELPALCERMFPLSTAREDRYAAGLSMGGYGAMKLGLLRPERYAAVASLSGAVDLLGMAAAADPAQVAFFADIFGTAGEMRGGDNDLPAVARRLIASGRPLPRVYMACGTEDFLYANNQGFLAEFGGPLSITYEEGPGGHTWAFWDEYIQRVLAWL